MHILHVVGARPNFMKAAPVLAAFREYGVRQTLVHTGQHYDAFMSDIFFQQLEIPEPDFNLAVGAGTHAMQTAEIMVRFEPVVLDSQPDLVVVYGDVNSTAAAALVCAKLLIPVAHVEAGLRSGDRTMPEEVNRLVTDQLSDVLFTPSEDGDRNLLREGVESAKIYRVGNVMIDTLIKLLPAARAVRRSDDVFERPYVLVTLHRPSNVDDADMLRALIQTLNDISRDATVVFPVHPRTRNRIADLGGEWKPSANLRLVDPVGYVEFLALQMHAKAVVTDSGGIQEETTYLGVPCLTVRENTERPVTVTIGSNLLIGRDTERLTREVRRILDGRGKKGHIPPMWDGLASRRIAEICVALHVERTGQALAPVR
jgi:UDP-N-acetylglucosamine 2-epimerase (non-hydrolysing)